MEEAISGVPFASNCRTTNFEGEKEKGKGGEGGKITKKTSREAARHCHEKATLTKRARQFTYFFGRGGGGRLRKKRGLVERKGVGRLDRQNKFKGTQKGAYSPSQRYRRR